MAYVIAICYLSSLVSYGMGYSEMLVFKNAVIKQLIIPDYTIQVSLATGYFILAIFFAVIGSFLYVRNNSKQAINEFKDSNVIKFKGKAVRESNNRRRTIDDERAYLR
ncbi:MAG: hypothetical protein P4L49_09680 [Desulfosporosinus sp.]|nr:hypothetical protein [Desulfosporosinus sp.]